MIIRTAMIADVPELCDLLSVLFQQEVEFAADVDLQTLGLESIIANPSVGFILIAQQAGEAIGMVSVLYSISTALGGRVGTLEDMVVTPHYRNRGVGKDLLIKALDLAVTNGCKRMTLLTDSDNFEAHRFYLKCGFKASSMVVYRQQLKTAESK